MSTQVSRHGVLHFYFHFHDCRQYSFLRLRLKLSRAVPPFILLHQMPSSPDVLLFKRSNLLLYQKFSFSPFLSLNFDSKHRLSCKRYTYFINHLSKPTFLEIVPKYRNFSTNCRNYFVSSIKNFSPKRGRELADKFNVASLARNTRPKKSDQSENVPCMLDSLLGLIPSNRAIPLGSRGIVRDDLSAVR